MPARQGKLMNESQEHPDSPDTASIAELNIPPGEVWASLTPAQQDAVTRQLVALIVRLVTLPPAPSRGDGTDDT